MHRYTCPGAGTIGCMGSHALELESQDAQVHMPWSWSHRMHRYTCPGAGVIACTGTHALEQGSQAAWIHMLWSRVTCRSSLGCEILGNSSVLFRFIIISTVLIVVRALTTKDDSAFQSGPSKFFLLGFSRRNWLLRQYGCLEWGSMFVLQH